MRLTEKEMERAQINIIRNEKEVTTKITQLQRIISVYYEQLYTNKMDNLEEMERKLQSPKTEPGRNRKYGQTNYQ